MTGQQTADDPKETTTDNLEAADEQESVERGHLDDVEDGCGCTEIWEHLSENREEPTDD